MLIYFILIVLIIIAVYLILIMPKIINKPDLKDFMGLSYAHRGLHQEKNISPENSLAAFQLAVDNDYGIELDVQLSKDLVPVVFHDASLKRVCGIDKKVRDMDYKELRELNLYDSNEKIPHLQELLDLVDDRVPLIVELKVYRNEDIDCPIIAGYLDSYKGLYCIESFNPISVLWYKKNRPQIVRGQLASKNIHGNKMLKEKILNFTLRNLMYNFLTKPDFIAYNQNISHLVSYNICRALYKPLTVAYTIKSQYVLNDKRDKFDLFIFEDFYPED